MRTPAAQTGQAEGRSQAAWSSSHCDSEVRRRLPGADGDSLPGDKDERPFTQKLAPQPRVVLGANHRPPRNAGTIRPRSIFRCPGHGRSHLSANRRQQLSQLPGDALRMQLGGWSPGVWSIGIPKDAPPLLPSSLPSFGSLPDRVFLLYMWFSDRMRCREVEAPCKPRGQRLYVNQLRHLPADQMQERAGPEQGRTDKDPETARQVVQIRLVIYLSTCPSPAILQCGKFCRASFRLDHEGWTWKTFHSTSEGLQD